MPSSSGLAPSPQDFSAGSGMDRSPRDQEVEEEIVQKELESQLVEVGNRLACPPSDVEELVLLLETSQANHSVFVQKTSFDILVTDDNKVEFEGLKDYLQRKCVRLIYFKKPDHLELNELQAGSLLVRVGQSPFQSMRTALFPTMKALVAKELLSHPHIDIRVSLAYCFSELTRITAPTDPYGENFLKDIFQLIVGSFQKLDDISNRSYQKRVSILQTIADVHSSNLMLDFEFDDLIKEMFEHFLKAISSNHTQDIFSPMETIMTRTINESSDNISEILCCLLPYVKSDKDNPPIAFSLAKKVLENCSWKLKPYLVEIMQNGDSTLSNYSDAVASICQHNSNASEFKEIYTSGDCLADGSMLSEKIISDKFPQVSGYTRPEAGPSEIIAVAVNSSVSSVCNDTLPNGNGDSILGTNYPKNKLNAAAGLIDCNVLVSSAPIVLSGIAGHYKESRIHKTNSLIQLEDASCHSQSCNKKSSRKSSRIKEGEEFQSDILFSREAGTCLLKETERRLEAGPSMGPDSEAVLTALPTTNASPATHPKKWKIAGKKDGTGKVAQNPSSVFGRNGDADGDQNAKEPLPSEAINAEDGFINNLTDKPPNRAGKVVLIEDTEVGESQIPSTPSRKKCDVASDSGRKSLPQTNRRSTRRSFNRDASEKQKPANFLSKKEPINFDEPTDLCLEGRFSKRRISNSVDKNQYQLNGSDKRNSLRKRAGGDESLKTQKRSDEVPVGSKIRVWWPDDKRFYKGIVASFDAVSKKHKIEYDDGDVEVLMLKDEKWKLLKDDSKKDGGRETDIQGSHCSSKKTANKKKKPGSNSVAKHIKTEASLNWEGIPVSKPSDYGTGFIVKKGSSDVTRTRRSNTRASKLFSSSRTSSDESFGF